MQRFVATGRLVRDPELRKVGETNVVNFSLAVKERPYKKDGEWVEKAFFIDCEAWDTGASTISEKWVKGQPITVEGTLFNSEWTSQDGTKRSKVKLRVSGFERSIPETAKNDKD